LAHLSILFQSFRAFEWFQPFEFQRHDFDFFFDALPVPSFEVDIKRLSLLVMSAKGRFCWQKCDFAEKNGEEITLLPVPFSTLLVNDPLRYV
jgi:hypothetical protein